MQKSGQHQGRAARHSEHWETGQYQGRAVCLSEHRETSQHQTRQQGTVTIRLQSSWKKGFLVWFFKQAVSLEESKRPSTSHRRKSREKRSQDKARTDSSGLLCSGLPAIHTQAPSTVMDGDLQSSSSHRAACTVPAAERAVSSSLQLAGLSGMPLTKVTCSPGRSLS